jgi:periplasmic mercuric ion binding protein
MKQLKIFLILLFTVALTATTSAQSHDHGSHGEIKKESAKSASLKTESIKVAGVCGMCKTRIEKAAKDGGASSAAWDMKTHILAVSFDSSKTSKEKLSKKIASVGHDTENHKAPDEVYAKLHECCHYERSK